MIKLNHITKTFQTPSLEVHACKDVTLDIGAGEIYGIIGFSGAGKSTLVRCINLLERPTSGQVSVDGIELTSLPEKELRAVRKKIGMIFQHFNLMRSRTVAQNIAYPLKGSGLSNDPKVLLCDEATSALDPQTTKSILRLLKHVNEQLGITIVLITHEMAVIKEICNRVAVMENGEVVEEGNILDVFSSPKQQVTRDFIDSTSTINKIYELIETDDPIVQLAKGESLVILHYTAGNTDKALISDVSRQFNIDSNIAFGNIEIIQNTPLGSLVVKLSGEEENIQKTILYLREHNVKVEVLKTC